MPQSDPKTTLKVAYAMTLIPLMRFRWKGAILQQAFQPTGGRGLRWMDVPAVAEDAPDAE